MRWKHVSTPGHPGVPLPVLSNSLQLGGAARLVRANGSREAMRCIASGPEHLSQ